MWWFHVAPRCCNRSQSLAWINSPRQEVSAMSCGDPTWSTLLLPSSGMECRIASYDLRCSPVSCTKNSFQSNFLSVIINRPGLRGLCQSKFWFPPRSPCPRSRRFNLAQAGSNVEIPSEVKQFPDLEPLGPMGGQVNCDEQFPHQNDVKVSRDYVKIVINHCYYHLLFEMISFLSRISKLPAAYPSASCKWHVQRCQDRVCL